ncbi:MAG: hypothetical protein ACRD3A_11050, partial [Terriglobales bacterium]
MPQFTRQSLTRMQDKKNQVLQKSRTHLKLKEIRLSRVAAQGAAYRGTDRAFPLSRFSHNLSGHSRRTRRV